jgi:triphosphatase
MHSVYVDTEELALAHGGVALRLRRINDAWEATAKWGGRVRGVVHERPELSVRLSRPPELPLRLGRGPLRTQLRPLTAGRPLLPILITDIRRHLRDVHAVASRGERLPLIEFALDRVCIRAPGRRRVVDRYCELELELLQGTRSDVHSLARLIRSRFQLQPSPESKFARGLRLLGHRRNRRRTCSSAPGRSARQTSRIT